MKIITSTFLVLCSSIFLFAAPSVVKLSGIVIRAGGGPLKDVRVSLKSVSSISAITGSDGKFMLAKGSTSVHQIAEISPPEFKLKGSTLFFSPTSGNIKGTVDVFTVNGKKTFSNSFTNPELLTQGMALPVFVPGLNIICMSINGKTYTSPILRIGKSLYLKEDFSTIASDATNSLSKLSADVVIDTIIAKKSGFKDKMTPITKYIDSNLTITMDSSGACIPPKAGTKKSNPIFTDVYSADPAVMVDNCTFYITAGHDLGPNHFNIREWYLLKSTDMVNWTRTTPLKLTAFSWTNANAWAGQMIKGLNGKYYWYVPINDIVYSKDRMAIGVAVADSPEGPWKDALGKPLINDELEMSHFNKKGIDETPHTIDPTVFIDDDGQAYLQYGGFWTMVTVKLNPDMISISGKLVISTPPDYFESPYLIKRNGIYYQIYACHRGNANRGNPPSIDYATSKSPMGPWTHRGTILPKLPNVSGQLPATNHAGVAEFAGQWYIVYHISNGPNGGGTYKRQVCIDKLYFNSDGTIKPVTPSSGISF